MLKLILKSIGQFKTPEQKVIVMLLLFSTIVLFKMFVRSQADTSKADKVKIVTMEIKYDSLSRSMQKKIDDCEDAKFRDKLDRIAELENYTKKQDSLIDRLRKIK